MNHLILKAAGSGLLLLLLNACQTMPENHILFNESHFAVYADSVVQMNNRSVALSDTEMVSNYKSPERQFLDADLQFKFSINGQDNEMAVGKNNLVRVPADGSLQTPVLTFGKPYTDTANIPASQPMPQAATLTFTVDMRPVLKAFQTQGYYTCFNGTKIYRSDFHGVYIAGNIAPLTWDFANLATHKDLQLQDLHHDGIYSITVHVAPYASIEKTAPHWSLSRDISAYPAYHCSQPLLNALYNMSLEEMLDDIRPDSTFMAGAKWDGVWTRDISYSILLSLAMLRPDIARNSLMKKVKDGRIIQDTGTGGSYPISTDRMVWSVAAWEVYKVTGDQLWLRQAYQIIRNSELQDAHNIYDPVTGLAKGESSFMDWREQSYPRWMSPKDIFNSEDLGTNAIHYEANHILSQMAGLLGASQDARMFEARAESIRAGINTYLWQPQRGYYGQYLYGQLYKSLSPRSDNLGEALCMLFGIAQPDQVTDILEQDPRTPFGMPCIYPEIPNIPPYHNDAVWPFVESFWAIAASRHGDMGVLSSALASIYRPAALFLTNKENFVAHDGDYLGTQVNSNRQLWSVAGDLATVYKVLFGLDFKADGIQFRPCIPQTLTGPHILTHFRYRQADLTIRIEGTGDSIVTATLDGQSLKHAFLPGTIKGSHTIHIRLTTENQSYVHPPLNPVLFAPETPQVRDSSGYLVWNPVAQVNGYRILVNGTLRSTTTGTAIQMHTDHYREYQVIAVDKSGLASFASNPVSVYPPSSLQLLEAESFAAPSAAPYKGYMGKGFVELSLTHNTLVQVPLHVADSGWYAIDFRYANGNGPINTDNKCAMRSLYLDQTFESTVVFPQRGTGQWSDWGFSNATLLHLTRGKHTLMLRYDPENANMNGSVNEAMLDEIRLIRIR